MGSSVIFFEIPLILSYGDPVRGGVFMWGTPRTRIYALRDRSFRFFVHSPYFDPNIPYKFTLAELHLAGGQFLFPYSLNMVGPHYNVPFPSFLYVHKAEPDLTQHFPIPDYTGLADAKSPLGHHVAAAQATHSNMAVDV
ncbi:uncharacterized protein DS421_3g83930 [Arachis hypogaea]|nr:uncharacterized protein DS421_3g83930 [Arachis hypogaea]